MRVIVVGSGIAGLVAAIRAARHHEVLLVTKGALEEGSTRHAQGGIAAALAEAAADAHIADTLAAGAGLCDPEAVRVLCEEGPQRVRDLIAFGVEFDRDPSGALARGLEAAHSAPRILHAGGDATGAAIEAALAEAVRATAVDIIEHAMLVDLVLDDRTPDHPRPCDECRCLASGTPASARPDLRSPTRLLHSSRSRSSSRRPWLPGVRRLRRALRPAEAPYPRRTAGSSASNCSSRARGASNERMR
ncbi:FAD-dependent oxidoreductase [Arenivirga flava]|uniref:L-aspartate oxidase n=1 Tax=Arenivirga flava TaxID=1930060 RepID=A0AA37UCY3_9MICO|nr:hypothetical protein GCM10025874_02870 [Arenivirga flava]